MFACRKLRDTLPRIICFLDDSPTEGPTPSNTPEDTPVEDTPEDTLLPISITDNDNDGYGIRDGVCIFEGKEAQCDCDDTNAYVNAGAEETCDFIDNDCDNFVDEDLPTKTYYYDEDGDGYGSEDQDVQACKPNTGYVEKYGDCDNTDPSVNPEAMDYWVFNSDDDDIDSNCNEESGKDELKISYIQEDGNRSYLIVLNGDPESYFLYLYQNYNSKDPWYVGYKLDAEGKCECKLDAEGKCEDLSCENGGYIPENLNNGRNTFALYNTHSECVTWSADTTEYAEVNSEYYVALGCSKLNDEQYPEPI